MKLSLSGFLFEDNYTSQSVDFAAFCSIAKSYGYAGVELRQTQVSLQTPKAGRKEMLSIVKDMGLVVTCLTARGLPLRGKERGDVFESYLELCSDMGCGLMKISGAPAWCHEAATKAEAYGVTLASNNHVGGQLETVDGTRAFINAVGHTNFGLLYDCMHLMVGREDYLGCISEFSEFTKNILMQSRRPARSEDESKTTINGKSWTRALPCESGVQDWQSVFAEFKRQNYDGLITVIENGWPVDRREEVARKCSIVVREMWGVADN